MQSLEKAVPSFLVIPGGMENLGRCLNREVKYVYTLHKLETDENWRAVKKLTFSNQLSFEGTVKVAEVFQDRPTNPRSVYYKYKGSTVIDSSD